MPPKRSAAPAFSTSALAMIRELRDRIEATKRDLHKKRAAAVATISEIDEALAELGETASPPPVAPTAKREPTVTRAPREAAAPGAPEVGKRVAQLRELLPWIGVVSERQQQIVRSRITGKSSSEIAAAMKLEPRFVENQLFLAKSKMKGARQTGAKPAARAPANDGEEADPAPVVALAGRTSGGVQANGNGYRWKIERNFRRYLGPTVDTEEEAEQGRVAALAALDRGEAPVTAPKYRSRAQREAARSVASQNANIPMLATDGERAKEPNNIPIVIPVDEVPDEPDDDAFADLAPVPLAEIPALVAGAPRTAPGVPTWILDRLLPEWWTAYQGVVVEKVHPDVVAYLNDTTAHEVSRKAKAAEVQIERLRAWEAGRAEDGVPLTDEDKLGTAPAAPDPLLAALGIKHEPKTQGDAKRAAMAAMSPYFHRLAPRQVQFAELYIAGKTNAEIAAEMGVRLATVDGMLAATRTRLEGCGRYTPPVAVVPPNDAQDAVIDSFKETGIERARAKLHVINGRQRAATIAPRRLSRDERKLGELLTTPMHIERPITRGDCEADPGRPCPWVGCKHNLFLDVNEDTGAIKLNFPHLEPWEMGESCSLDVADRGGVTLEETGAIVNLTRERIRQIEVRGLEKIRKHGGDMEDARERDHSPLGGVIG